MKVVFTGEGLHPNLLASGSRMRMLAARVLGHEVVPVCALPFYSMGGRWVAGIQQRLKWGPNLWAYNRAILSACEEHRPDVLWVEKGVWVFADTIRRVRKMGITCVHYTPDPALVAQRSRHVEQAIPLYDVMVTNKSYEMEAYKRLGARRLLLQPPTFDLRLHRPYTPQSEDMAVFGTDLSFVGTYRPGREVFLHPLAAAGLQLAIWGWGWEKCPDPQVRACCRMRSAEEDDYVRAICCSKIGLGLLCTLWPDQVTTRSVEIPACGGFLLAQRTPEHEALFQEGVEAEFFSTEEELLAKARYYLEHDEKRLKIAAAGRERCFRSGYSNDDCLREVFREVERCRALTGAELVHTRQNRQGTSQGRRLG